MKYLIVLVALVGSREACEIYGKGVSDADKAAILNKHNHLRELITNGQVPDQPRGVNMNKLKWDNKLASAAQNIANSCEFGHKGVKDARWQVGQNLYWRFSNLYSEDEDWKGAIQSWFDEHKDYEYSSPFSPSTGHYTQVVWADTKYVGCGYTFYKETENDIWYNKLYVCNYGPAGNWVGEVPYETKTSEECKDCL